MASDAGAIATETPPPSRPAEAAGATTVSAATALPSEEAARLLKRQREATPPSPHSLDPLGSPTKSARLALATGPSPPPLTGAAALEDERRRQEAEQAANPPASSDNPSHKVLASLLAGGTQGMSRPSDAPSVAPTANMDGESSPRASNPAAIAAEAADRVEENEAAGPHSPHSADGIAGAPVTASPTPMDVDSKGDDMSQQVSGQEERAQPSSLSYPGSLQASANLAEPSPRGMSFPMPSQGQSSPTSSSSKKHKCPYCNTEFTRHHNLKSHLLTHSQEKPYVCTECPLRFRRLHDLKRHGKLHTGEKPHICPKCDRKFARGDALARHSKGAGGCAGRRSSMGSFADGEDLEGNTIDGDDSAMSGLGYEPGEEDELRRQSMPTGSTQHVDADGYSAQSRTYPPAMPRPGSGLYPPNANQAQASSAGSSSIPNSMASSHTAGTSLSSAAAAGGNTGMYSQSGMTESPKALSPGIPGHEASSTNRQRSPGLSQQLQQQQLGRRQSELQSSQSGQTQAKVAGLSHPTFPTTSAMGVSHGRTPSGSQDSRNMFAQSDPSVWAYIQSLEEKVKVLSDKVLSLDHEVAALKEGRDNRGVQVQDGEATAPAPST